MRLVKKDYEQILGYYGKKPVYKINNKTKKRIYCSKKTKELTRRILSKKLCDCIKKVQKNSKKRLTEKGAIAICNKSIFSNRGIKHYKFTCKKGSKLHAKKGSSTYLSKTRNLTFTRKNKL